VGRFLDGDDTVANFLRGGHSFFRQFAHFVGHHRESATGFARSRRFNGRVEC
jgi:hypothetical protein